jgi:hypothetical protein
MKTKREFLQRGWFQTNNVKQTKFRIDTGMDDTPLSVQYPSHNNIAWNKQATVAEVFTSIPLII